MLNFAQWRGGVFLLAAVALPAGRLLAEDPAERQKLFSEAIEAYRAGNQPEVLSKLEQFLAAHPTAAEAMELATGAGQEALFEMLKSDALRGVAAQVLNLSIAQQERLAVDPESIQQVVQECLLVDPEKSRAVAWEAQTRLSRVGEAAIPVLMDLLQKTRETGERSRLLALAERLEPATILPWSECLAVRDQALRYAVLRLVAKLLEAQPRMDARCLYALAHVAAAQRAADSADPVRNEAEAILSARLAKGEPTGAAQLFLRAGEALFLSEPVRLLSHRVGRLSLPLAQVFSWDESAQGLRPVDLASFQVAGAKPIPGFVPSFAANEILAELAALHALRLDQENDAALALYTCAVLAEASENDEVQKRAAVFPESNAFLPALAGRRATLAREAIRLQSAGSRSLSGALRRALSHQRDGAAKALIGMLSRSVSGVPFPADEAAYRASRGWGLARFLPGSAAPAGPPGGGVPAGADLTPLLDALDYPNPLIQYCAALALAEIDPAAPFYRRERVVPLLARALADTRPQVVLVVSFDPGFANRIAEALLSQGVGVVRATDGLEAIQKAREYPAKDAILLDAGSQRKGRAPPRSELATVDSPEGVFNQLQQDFRTRRVPTWIVLPEGVAEAPAAYPRAVLAGTLRRALDAGELAGLGRSLAEASAASPDVSRSVALEAAGILSRMDPIRSVYASDLPEVATVLAGAIRRGAGKAEETLSEPLRIGYLAALANVGTSREAPFALQVAQDASASTQLRAAALRAAGILFGKSAGAADAAAVQTFRTMLADQAEEVRAAAAFALGRLNLPVPQAGAILLNR